MAIKNYWWLLIWMFLGLIFEQFPKDKVMTKNGYELRWKNIGVVLLMLPLIIWTGYRTTAWGDSLLSS